MKTRIEHDIVGDPQASAEQSFPLISQDKYQQQTWQLDGTLLRPAAGRYRQFSSITPIFSCCCLNFASLATKNGLSLLTLVLCMYRCKLSITRLLDCPFRVISAFLRKLFEIADSNKDGVLQHGEFTDLLQRCGSFIGSP